MSQGFITNTGLSLLASHQANEQPLIINRFLLANIPGLDPTQAPNLNEALPAENNRVGAFPVIKPATPGPNQVIYSLVLDSTVGDFTYNWVGLLTENDELIAARYIEPETKLKRQNGFSSGDVVVRNFLLTYTNVENIVNITITPESWQLNFTKATQTTPGLTTYGDQAGTACEGNDSRLTTDLSVAYYDNGVDVFSSTGKKAFIFRATSQEAGMMAAEDKGKLNGIQEGAQVNVGTNLSVEYFTNRIELNSSTGQDTAIGLATSSRAGLISPDNFNKINAIESAINDAINAAVPAGLIALWAGAINQIPNGWALCDGQDGRPNMLDRFVIGAGDNYSVGAVGGSFNKTTSTNGAHSHTLTINNTTAGGGVGITPTSVTGSIGISSSSVSGTVSIGNRTPTISTTASHSHKIWRGRAAGNTSTASQHGDNMIFDGDSSSVGGNAAHNHSATFTGGSHSHIATLNLDSHGHATSFSGTPHNHSGSIANNGNHSHSLDVTPPYFAAAYITRLAS